MLLDEPLEVAEFRCLEADVGGKRNRSKPELGLAVLALNMDVRRLIRLAAVEMKAVGADAKHRWHGRIVRKGFRLSNSQCPIFGE